MKKSEMALLWVGGIWTVGWLFVIATEGGWSSGIAMIWAGWLVCVLVLVSIRKWPQRSLDIPSRKESKAKTLARRAVPSLGYLLAIVFLLAWLNVRVQIREERGAVRHIVSGLFHRTDCAALPGAQAGRCIERTMGFIPDDIEGNIFDAVAAQSKIILENGWVDARRSRSLQCSLIQAIFSAKDD